MSDIAFVIRPEPHPLKPGTTIWRAYILQSDSTLFPLGIGCNTPGDLIVRVLDDCGWRHLEFDMRSVQ